MIRAAVIGLGTISAVHLDAIASNPKITLAAVCDTDETRREQAPDGVPFYPDYCEMVRRERPDTAHVCLPHYLHYPVSRKLAEMGVHVFCEKPRP